MSQVRLSVDGALESGAALWQWLRAEPELRGLVSREQAAAETGAMGGAPELVVTLASTGTLAVVARAVGVWLTHRHSDVTVTVALADGTSVVLDAHRAQTGDVERLLLAAGATAETRPDLATGADSAPGTNRPPSDRS